VIEGSGLGIELVVFKVANPKQPGPER